MTENHRARRPQRHVDERETEVVDEPPSTTEKPVRVSFIKKIISRGLITIPADVLEVLGVAEGDIVEFEVVRILRRAPSK